MADIKLPGNSLAPKQPPAVRKANKVAQGKEQKEGIGKRIADSFLQTTGEDLVDRVIFNWIIPGFKNMIEDLVHMILNPGKPIEGITRRNGELRVSELFHRSYKDERGGGSLTRQEPKRSRSPQLTFVSQEDAEKVIAEIAKLYSAYGRVTMYNLYEAAGLEDIADWPMKEIGWYDLSAVRAIPGRGGQWILEMPKAEEMK